MISQVPLLKQTPFYFYIWYFMYWALIFILFKNILVLKFLSVGFLLDFFNMKKENLSLYLREEGR